MRFIIYIFLLAFFPFFAFAQNIISGDISMPDDTPICDVLVELRNANNEVIAQDLSDENGLFAFDNATQGEDYSLHFAREISALNGVSTFDMILMFRLILGIDPITSYSAWAADLNDSGQITTLDMVLARRLILAIDEELEVSSWGFDEPTASVPDNVIAIDNLSSAVNIEVIGVKRGDLNYSATGGCQ